MVSDRFIGALSATRLPGDLIRLNMLIPGPMRVTRAVIEQGDPEYVERVDDTVTFRGVNSQGEQVAYGYRIVGSDESGPEGGWLLCEPLT